MSRERKEITHIVLLGVLILFAFIVVFFSVHHGISGKTTSTTVLIINASPANCTFDVGAGYNIISLPCLSTATPILDAVNNTNVAAMYQYVPGDADRWRVYNPNLPSYVVSDLQYLTRRAGYVTVMNAAANVTLSGLHVQQTDINLAAGWNLVGFPSFINQNVSDALAAIGGSVSRVVGYQKPTESYIIYPSGVLVLFVPGQGYWINATAPATWSVSS